MLEEDKQKVKEFRKNNSNIRKITLEQLFLI